MRNAIRLRWLLAFSALLFVSSIAAAEPEHALDAFNQKFTEAIRHMDNAAVMSLWAEDGVSLLPGTAPIAGRAAIQRFMDDVTSRTKGFKVLSHDNDWRDVHVSGDWASEWALTKQVVQPPDGKPILTINGKMLLVLHRDKDGAWKILHESWTSNSSS